MPDRRTDPTCQQHWPMDGESLIPAVWSPRSSATILEDIKRAAATINAAPAYKHDCQAQGCADE